MRAAEIIRSGGLGQVTGVRGNIKSTLANNGPHLIDTLRFILGDPAAVRVTCRCRRERGDFNRGIPAEDAANGEILFRGGFRFEFSTGDLSPDFFTIVVEGSGGSLEVTPQAPEGQRRDLYPQGCDHARLPAEAVSGVHPVGERPARTTLRSLSRARGQWSWCSPSTSRPAWISRSSSP